MRIRSFVLALTAATAACTVGVAGAGQRDQEREASVRPVTARGCVLRLEQVRGGPVRRGTRGPEFILMNAAITQAGAATTQGARGTSGAQGSAQTEGGGPPIAHGDDTSRGRGGGDSRGATRPGSRQEEYARQGGAQNTTPGGNSGSNVVRQYLLEGTADFSAHVGHQVEVSGMLEPITINPADGSTPATAQTTGNPVLQVKSVKPLGERCSR